METVTYQWLMDIERKFFSEENIDATTVTAPEVVLASYLLNGWMWKGSNHLPSRVQRDPTLKTVPLTLFQKQK
ncbi:hypothetical protein AVEN_271830-1, partial [Araneus ventricosus]